MSLRFNADDIFEMALQIERNGAAFYRQAADSLQDTRARDLLLTLAQKEVEHEATFASMRSQLTTAEREPLVWDPEDESAQYLQAVADREVFDRRTGAPDVLTGKETYQEILLSAIGKEKDSILFYLGLKDLVPETLGRGRIDAIIREEMHHIRVLTNVLTAMHDS